MKNIRYYITLSMSILLGGLLQLSCSDDINVDTPAFNVSVSSANVKVGETVTFNLEGDPDIISFYSGDMGNDYAYLNKDRILPVQEVRISFNNQGRNLGSPIQEEVLHILVSHDLLFSGTTKEDSLACIEKATWENLTNKFTLATDFSGTSTYVASGEKDVLEYFSQDSPNYVAFRYTNRTTTEYGKAPIWRIQNFNLKVVNEVSVITAMTQATAGWTSSYSAEYWGTNAYSTASSTITMRGLATNVGTHELWCVSKPVTISETNLGRDFGIAVKSVTDVPLKSYDYQFNKPGTYNVVFVAINSSVDSYKEKVCQVQINVEQ